MMSISNSSKQMFMGTAVTVLVTLLDMCDEVDALQVGPREGYRQLEPSKKGLLWVVVVVAIVLAVALPLYLTSSTHKLWAVEQGEGEIDGLIEQIDDKKTDALTQRRLIAEDEVADLETARANYGTATFYSESDLAYMYEKDASNWAVNGTGDSKVYTYTAGTTTATDDIIVTANKSIADTADANKFNTYVAHADRHWNAA